MQTSLLAVNQPTIPRRAVIVGFCLLLLSSALALRMTQRIEGNRIKPTGWEISFQAPAGYVINKAIEASGPTSTFSFTHANDRQTTIWIQRLDIPPDWGHRGVVKRMIREHLSSDMLPFVLAGPTFSATIGPFHATETRLPSGKGVVIVRTCFPTEGIAYAFMLQTTEQALPKAYLQFQLLAQSVKPIQP